VIAYVDTSALLRLVLREPGALEELRSCEALVSSELITVESFRTIDRLRLQGALSAEDAAARRDTVTEWLEAVDLVLLQRPILSRASEPFPTPLGTLDALHLSTALVWQDRMCQKLVMATHDRNLGVASRSYGLGVRGI
jgi:predicted nucleic acid-binding protein